MIKFSTTITCQYDTSFSPFSAAEYDQALDWVYSSGFDGAELCIANYDGLDVKKLKKDLEERGLGCSTISTGQARTLEDISLIHDDPGAQQKAQRRIFEHIDAAAVLGSKVTIGLLRGLGETGRLSTQTKLLMKNLEPCLEYAQSRRVVLLLEAINRYETAIINSAEQALAFIAAMGAPECLGILWDVFHANIEDDTFDQAIDSMGDQLQHVHLADSNRAFPGWGHIDFDSVYDRLKAAGYSEYLSFECINRPSAQVVREQSAGFISRLRRR
ncbi:MAG: sugar phosphate isomerase/epimerase [Negativicutes bacterium]|nr:sugar phosphate isomerase/epimerase [Negativicutes bacterium]